MKEKASLAQKVGIGEFTGLSGYFRRVHETRSRKFTKQIQNTIHASEKIPRRIKKLFAG